MKIYLMRHSETDWNRQMRCQGQEDIPLNENGRKIASLAGEGMKDVPIDLCISSPLTRALESARLVLEKNMRYIEQGRIFRTDSRLMEVNFGVWEGFLVNPSAGKVDPILFRRFFNDTGDTYCPQGAESMMDVEKRTSDFLDDTLRDKSLQDKNILVMSHGAAIRCMLRRFSDDPEYFHKFRNPLNCETYILESDSRGEIDLIAKNILYYDESLAEDLYHELYAYPIEASHKDRS